MLAFFVKSLSESAEGVLDLCWSGTNGLECEPEVVQPD